MRVGPVVAGVSIALGILLLVPGIPGGSDRSTPLAAPGHSFGLTTDASFLPPDVPARPYLSAQNMFVGVTVASRDPLGLANALRAVSDPGSPAYRHFLTSPAFDAHFGPGPGSTGQVEAYLQQRGATRVSASADGSIVLAELPARAFPSVFGAPLMEYPAADGFRYTLGQAPELPPEIAAEVSSVSGLSGWISGGAPSASPPRAVGEFVVDGATQTKWYIGSDYAQAYGELPLLPGGGSSNASYATGEAVATILMSGFNQSQGLDLVPFDPRAVSQYFNDTFPGAWPKPTIEGVPVTIGGVTPPLPGPIQGPNDTTFNQVENSLDLEMAGSTAPGAHVVNFYFPGSQFESGSAQAISNSADFFATALASALAFNYSPQRLVAVSNSYGLPDLNASSWNLQVEKATMMGVTVLAASGDQGNAPPELTGRFQGQWPTWPGSAAFDSYGVVAVGGTTVDLAGASTGTYVPPNLPVAYDSSITGTTSEAAWWDTLAGSGRYSGSEGGASLVFAEPTWQFLSAAQWPIVNATVLQGLSTLNRAEPDLAFAANATLLYLSEDALGNINFSVVEGTSVSSPLMAGLLAEMTAVGGHPFGYLDPELYRIGSFYAAHPGTVSAFHDVLAGSNYYFTAGPGWDATTGWGSLNATRFVAADANSTIADYAYVGPTPGLPPPSGGPSYSLGTGVLLAIGIGLTITAAIVLIVGRPRPPKTGAAPPPGAGYSIPPPPPPGAGPYPPPPPPPGAAASATFNCPYCGAERPAEPVRCPSCGAL